MPSTPSGGAKRGLVKLIVYLPGIFSTEAEVLGNCLQRGAFPNHVMKFFNCILSVFAIFLTKLPLELVSRFDVELIPPMRRRSRCDIEQAGDLRIRHGVNLHPFTDKLFNTPFIDFQCAFLLVLL